MTTGEKLQKLRKEKNYTQEELADILGVSRQSISKWESDAAFPETEKLITLSKLFQCSVDYLLNEENDEKELIGENTDYVIKKYNKKKLPFAITTLSVALFTYFDFIFHWFDGYQKDGYFFGHIYSAQDYGSINIYHILFYSKDYKVGNVIALLSFVTLIAITISSIVYFYVESKKLNLTIKILNCLLFLFLTLLSVCAGLEGLLASVIEVILLAALVILQFALKPLREIY